MKTGLSHLCFQRRKWSNLTSSSAVHVWKTQRREKLLSWTKIPRVHQLAQPVPSLIIFLVPEWKAKKKGREESLILCLVCCYSCMWCTGSSGKHSALDTRETAFLSISADDTQTYPCYRHQIRERRDAFFSILHNHWQEKLGKLCESMHFTLIKIWARLELGGP